MVLMGRLHDASSSGGRVSNYVQRNKAEKQNMMEMLVSRNRIADADCPKLWWSKYILNFFGDPLRIPSEMQMEYATNLGHPTNVHQFGGLTS